MSRLQNELFPKMRIGVDHARDRKVGLMVQDLAAFGDGAVLAVELPLVVLVLADSLPSCRWRGTLRTKCGRLHPVLFIFQAFLKKKSSKFRHVGPLY